MNVALAMPPDWPPVLLVAPPAGGGRKSKWNVKRPGCHVPRDEESFREASVWGGVGRGREEPSLSSSDFVCVCVFRATPSAYGSSQARGHIRTVATGLHHSHSNTRSEPCL